MSGLIGVIGGSGVYEMEGLEDIEEKRISTPFGEPSDSFVIGSLEGRRVAFLPRHGRGHRILPSEVNSRANLWAMKSLGIDWVIAISACGSMKEEIRPRDVVIPDQLFDRTRGRPSTFFGEGIVGHISFDEPYCPIMREALIEAARGLGLPVHDGGTYVCIEGPSFSTKAESRIFRSWGVDVIGMTNLPEAKIAREAEMAFATIALATDYDVWREGEEVSVEGVIENLKANVENVKKIVKAVIPRIPDERVSPAHDALKGAIMTERDAWPEETIGRLGPIIERYL